MSLRLNTHAYAHTPDAILANKSQHKTGERKKHVYVETEVYVSDKKGNETKKIIGMTETSTFSCMILSLLSPHFLPGKYLKKQKILTEAELVEKWFGRMQHYQCLIKWYIRWTIFEVQETHYSFFLWVYSFFRQNLANSHCLHTIITY